MFTGGTGFFPMAIRSSLATKTNRQELTFRFPNFGLLLPKDDRLVVLDRATERGKPFGGASGEGGC